MTSVKPVKIILWKDKSPKPADKYGKLKSGQASSMSRLVSKTTHKNIISGR